MTRLQSTDLAGLSRGLEAYDRELRAKTGRTLFRIACRGAGVGEKQAFRAAEKTTVAAISVTAGGGVIPGFAEAVRDVIAFLGFRAFVPELTDVAGLAMAVERGADVLLMADDRRFVALNLSAHRVVDNAEATGRGYGAALEGLAGGLEGERVLVIGAGRVGAGCARILKEMGAKVGLFDVDTPRAEALARDVDGTVETDPEAALETYDLVVDACPASGIIEARHIKPTTLVVAPGIPLGLAPEARRLVESRLVHDPLQIGVATMVIAALV